MGGEELVQEVWKRVWNGYTTFVLYGTFGDDLQIRVKKINEDPNSRVKLEENMKDMIKRKAKYASHNHGTKSLGGHRINDLFSDPALFLSVLATSDVISVKKPSESRIFQLTASDGPMYRVFTDDELDLWKAWITSLGTNSTPPSPPTPPTPPTPPSPSNDTIGVSMSQLVNTLRERQKDIRHHKSATLTGPDPSNSSNMIVKPVAWWFQQKKHGFNACIVIT